MYMTLFNSMTTKLAMWFNPIHRPSYYEKALRDRFGHYASHPDFEDALKDALAFLPIIDNDYANMQNEQ